MIHARAPGKLFLWGEYSVLEGGPAIACAVDRYVNVHFLQGEGAEHADARRWRDAARQALRLHGFDEAFAEQPISIDSRALYSPDGMKYGLGSSAAVAAALTGLLLSADGDLPAKDVQLRIAAELHQAHRGPGGSGVDVATSLYGGTIAVRGRRVESLRWPAGLSCVVIWSGKPADTRQAIGRFRSAMSEGKPPVTRALSRLTEAAESVQSAWNRGASETMSALAHYTTAWRELDLSAKLGVYSVTHRHLQRLAETAGCVYKPSGAGGGDCGLAFARGVSCLESLRGSVRAAGFALLDLDLAAEGMRVRFQSE